MPNFPSSFCCADPSRVSWLLSGAAANRASKPVSLAETGFVKSNAFSAIFSQTNPYPRLHILHPVLSPSHAEMVKSPCLILVKEILKLLKSQLFFYQSIVDIPFHGPTSSVLDVPPSFGSIMSWRSADSQWSRLPQKGHCWGPATFQLRNFMPTEFLPRQPNG